MDANAARDVPLAHKNPKTRGTKAPLVKKSDAIQDTVSTDCIRTAKNNAMKPTAKVANLATITVVLALA